jgi:HD-GYP domain-containing protein (c-di-GMP phosphodiesterase class II)
MKRNRSDTNELVDVLKRLAEQSDKDYDLDLVEKIVECEAEFTDSPDEGQKTRVKNKIRPIVENTIN